MDRGNGITQKNEIQPGLHHPLGLPLEKISRTGSAQENRTHEIPGSFHDVYQDQSSLPVSNFLTDRKKKLETRNRRRVSMIQKPFLHS